MKRPVKGRSVGSLVSPSSWLVSDRFFKGRRPQARRATSTVSHPRIRGLLEEQSRMTVIRRELPLSECANLGVGAASQVLVEDSPSVPESLAGGLRPLNRSRCGREHLQGPHETSELAGDGGDGHLLLLPSAHEPCVTFSESRRRVARDARDLRRLPLESLLLTLGDRRLSSIRHVGARFRPERNASRKA